MAVKQGETSWSNQQLKTGFSVLVQIWYFKIYGINYVKTLKSSQHKPACRYILVLGRVSNLQSMIWVGWTKPANWMVLN